jgi:hypothetical protein
MHWLCTGSDGTAEQTNDYVRVNEENFKGTLYAETRVGTLGTATITDTGKWVSDLAPDAYIPIRRRREAPGGQSQECPNPGMSVLMH